MKQITNKKVQFLALSIIVLFLISLSTTAFAFLWKPVSESSGKLVILFHNQYRIENVTSVYIEAKGKQTKPSSTKQNGANGDRIHCRFNAPGSTFGVSPKVVLNLKSGKSVSWIVPNGEKRHEAGAGTVSAGGGTMDDVLADDDNPNDGSLISLTASNQGSKEYKCEKAETLVISPYLTTYGPANLSVIVKKADGKEVVFIEWNRSGDSDPSAVKVNGKEEADSMFEENAGDMSAKAGLRYELEVEDDDIIVLTLKGDFGKAPGSLKMFAK